MGYMQHYTKHTSVIKGEPHESVLGSKVRDYASWQVVYSVKMASRTCKTVLVQLEKFSRILTFDNVDEAESDVEVILRRVREVFKDKLVQDDQLTLQLKDKTFDMFVDLVDSKAAVDDKSVLNLIVEKPKVLK